MLQTRRKWRHFRQDIDISRDFPILSYKNPNTNDAPHQFRFYGQFDSTCEDNRIWLKNEKTSISLYLKDAQIWLLPYRENTNPSQVEWITNTHPQKLKVQHIPFLRDDACVFVAGTVITDTLGRSSFQSTANNPLIVLIHDQTDHQLLIHTMVSARPHREYWNHFTPFGLALGIFAELLLAMLFSNRPAWHSSMVSALCAALVPLVALLPTALPFTSISRRIWHKGRFYRACMDLMLLPLRQIPPGTQSRSLPNGEIYSSELFPCSKVAKKFPQLLQILPEEEQASWDICRIYGVQQNGTLGISQDPAIIHAALPQDPVLRAEQLRKKARGLELRAGVIYMSSMICNTILLWLLLNLLLRS